MAKVCERRDHLWSNLIFPLKGSRRPAQLLMKCPRNRRRCGGTAGCTVIISRLRLLIPTSSRAWGARITRTLRRPGNFRGTAPGRLRAAGPAVRAGDPTTPGHFPNCLIASDFSVSCRCYFFKWRDAVVGRNWGNRMQMRFGKASLIM